MNITIFEIGNSKTDIQNGIIKNFKGTINDYGHNAIMDIKNNEDLKFLSYCDTDNGGILIEYENKKMNNKFISHYANEEKR